MTLARALVYLTVGCGVAAVWTYYARTEKWENRYNSIVAIADGEAPSPFVKRRLPVDAARVVVALVPPGAWRAVGSIPGARRLLTGELGWPEGEYPILLATSLLIAGSVAGFMASARSLILGLYEVPPLLADAAGLLLGVGLLGGCASTAYQWYPYDFSNVFLFTLTLAGMIRGRPWYVLAFAASVYCKETALLLIPARALIARDPRSRRLFGELAGLVGLFLAIRIPIGRVYDSPPGADFWFPARNAKLLARALVFQSWWWPVVLVAAIRLRSNWGQFPRALRRLTLLPLALLSVAFFKGWIEELRQYSEALAILGPLAFQFVILELGHPALMRSRPADGPEPAAEARPTLVARPAGA